MVFEKRLPNFLLVLSEFVNWYDSVFLCSRTRNLLPKRLLYQVARRGERRKIVVVFEKMLERFF